MGPLRFGIIGIIIIIPLLFVSHSRSRGTDYQTTVIERCKDSIDQASYDAAFALKTYVMQDYDSRNPYDLEIPYQEVINVFFDSLQFRNFKYQAADFWLIGFIEADGIVFYNPENRQYLGKYYYIEQKNEQTIYYTMFGERYLIGSDGQQVQAERNQALEIDPTESDKVGAIVAQTLEQKLTELSYQIGPFGMEFSLPQTDDSFYQNSVNDVSFLVFYYKDNYYGIGEVEQVSIKAAGIMKQLQN